MTNTQTDNMMSQCDYCQPFMAGGGPSKKDDRVAFPCFFHVMSQVTFILFYTAIYNLLYITPSAPRAPTFHKLTSHKLDPSLAPPCRKCPLDVAGPADRK